MNKEKSTEKVSRPQLVKLDKALKLAEKWVSDMSKETDEGSIEVQLEGRPLGLGLGATVPRQRNVGPITDPVERKLQASLAMGKRKANNDIEKATDRNDIEADEDEDEKLDSRASLFSKKKMVPLNPSIQPKKKKK